MAGIGQKGIVTTAAIYTAEIKPDKSSGEFGLFADYGRDLVFVFKGCTLDDLGKISEFSGIPIIQRG